MIPTTRRQATGEFHPDRQKNTDTTMTTIGDMASTRTGASSNRTGITSIHTTDTMSIIGEEESGPCL